MWNQGGKRQGWRRLTFIVGLLSASLVYTGTTWRSIGPHNVEAATLAAPGAKPGSKSRANHSAKPARQARSHAGRGRRLAAHRPIRFSSSPRTAARTPPRQSSQSSAPVADSDDQTEAAAAAKSAPVTVTILAGDVDGTAAHIAADISAVLDSDDLRVMTVLGKGSAENLHEIAASPYLDLALVSSDALDEAKRQGLNDIAKRVTYIAPLYNEEVQILARGDIATIRQLDGRKVGVDVAGSSISDRASSIFGALGIKPDMINLDQSRALALLQDGTLDAIVFTGGKPMPALAALPPQQDLHFVAIPYESALQDSYYPARLGPQDYPNLVTPGGEVDTIAIGTILAAYNAPVGSPRYRKLALFTQAFFREFDHLLQPGRHPKWQEVNFAADAPGWQRFKPAQDWLDQSENIAATER